MSNETIYEGGAENASSAFRSKVERQDLSLDQFIAPATRTSIDGVPVPTLGGIPLLRKIGAGGMGCVYFGVHPRLKMEVAVKVLTTDGEARTTERVQRFFREAQVSARIRSLHLISVIDVNEENGLVYLVMEYVNGPSAGGRQRELRGQGKALSETEALDICIGAAAGLAAAHAAGIIHRDIKPDNILLPLGKNGQPNYAAAKLTDLGLAHWEQGEAALTRPGMVFGTPGFLAPEQSVDAASAGKPADVFGLGASLYFLLAGGAPFGGNTLLEVILAAQRMPHAPIRSTRPDVSQRTAELIDRCLAKDPRERLADGEALAAQLKLCRDALSPAAPVMRQSRPLARPPVAPPPRPSSKAQAVSSTLAATAPTIVTARPAAPVRRRWPLAIAVLLMVAAVSTAAILYAKGARPQPGGAASSTTPPPAPPNAAPAPAPVESPELFLDLGGGVKMELVPVASGVMETSRKYLFTRFFAGKYPVTVAQFRRFVIEHAYVTEAETGGDGREVVRNKWQNVRGATWKNPGFPQGDDHPVVMVTLADAEAFCKWAAERSGRAVALPGFVEWEYIARGGEAKIYPWGDTWDGKHANHADLELKNSGNAPDDVECSSISDGYAYTSPVGKFANASWCGAFDLCGNVWEWCEHPRGATKEDAMRGFARGGAWDAPPSLCRTAGSRRFDPEWRASTIGLRIVVHVGKATE